MGIGIDIGALLLERNITKGPTMKRVIAIALLTSLFACSDGASNDSADMAKSVISNLTEARKMLAAVNTVEEAQALEANLASVGKSYAEAVEKLKTLDQSDPDIAQQTAKITPVLAAEYQGLILELNALQARNSKASQVLMDELQAFKPKR